MQQIQPQRYEAMQQIQPQRYEAMQSIHRQRYEAMQQIHPSMYQPMYPHVYQHESPNYPAYQQSHSDYYYQQHQQYQAFMASKETELAKKADELLAKEQEIKLKEKQLANKKSQLTKSLIDKKDIPCKFSLTCMKDNCLYKHSNDYFILNQLRETVIENLNTRSIMMGRSPSYDKKSNCIFNLNSQQCSHGMSCPERGNVCCYAHPGEFFWCRTCRVANQHSSEMCMNK